MIQGPDDQFDMARYERIARRERARTMAEIEAQPKELQSDLMALWQAIQEAVNAYIAREGRTLDERVVRTVLRLQADEIDRIVQAAREGV